MDLMKQMAIACFVLAVPQGIEAFLQLRDRATEKNPEESITSGARHPILRALPPLVSIVLMVSFGLWLLYHPLKPSVVEKTITVEKVVPCPIPPPAKSGNAMTRGANSPAISGSGNSVTNSQPMH